MESTQASFLKDADYEGFSPAESSIVSWTMAIMYITYQKKHFKYEKTWNHYDSRSNGSMCSGIEGSSSDC